MRGLDRLGVACGRDIGDGGHRERASRRRRRFASPAASGVRPLPLGHEEHPTRDPADPSTPRPAGSASPSPPGRPRRPRRARTPPRTARSEGSPSSHPPDRASTSGAPDHPDRRSGRARRRSRRARPRPVLAHPREHGGRQLGGRAAARVLFAHEPVRAGHREREADERLGGEVGDRDRRSIGLRGRLREGAKSARTARGAGSPPPRP